MKIDIEQPAAVSDSLTIDELSKREGVSRTYIYREINAGRLKARKRGRRTIILREDVRAWLKALPEYQPAAPSAA
jgi:excisionase family DNA binding protein